MFNYLEVKMGILNAIKVILKYLIERKPVTVDQPTLPDKIPPMAKPVITEPVEPPKTVATAPVTVPPPQTTIGYSEAFLGALSLVLKYEGGFSDIPADHGGATNKGITQREYDKYRKLNNRDIQSVRFIDDSEVKEIYYTNYWIAGKCHLIPAELGIVHFDTCVNCGVKQASKFAQRSVGAVDDGIIGSRTIEMLFRAVRDRGIVSIVHTYLECRSNFYYALVDKDPSQKVFIKGWQNRIASLTTYIDKKMDTAIV